MRRLPSPLRPNWIQRCEDRDFFYHSIDGLYWQERYAYQFTQAQIDVLIQASKECHEMTLDTLNDVIARGNIEQFGLQPLATTLVEESWAARHIVGGFSLYGRFDFSWDGASPPKMLEYNADTPTGLLESGVVQADWLSDIHPTKRQFNRLDELLPHRWSSWRTAQNDTPSILHLVCADKSEEDWGNLKYMASLAQKGGVTTTNCLRMSEIQWDEAAHQFTDAHGNALSAAFKLYPSEWMLADDFSIHLPISKTQWIEPWYKVLLSSKALLPILWQRFKGHPNLLAAHFELGAPAFDVSEGFVKKPFFSREGANVALTTESGESFSAPGVYGKEGWVIQALATLPQFGTHFTCCGSWMVGGEPAGLGIREDFTPITKDTSLFVPHFVVD